MDREELENQKAESIAMKTAKETAKKQAKKQTRKMIMHVVKAVVIPMLLKLVWVFAIIMGICMLFSAFNLVVNSEEEEEEEEYDSVVEAIDITAEEWMATEEQISSYITNYNTAHEDLRTVMLTKTSDIIKWQTDYGYSAMFFVTVAFEEYTPTTEDIVEGEEVTEGEIATDEAEQYFSDFLSNMSGQASTWKDSDGNKLTTIKEIAEVYVGDETYEEWANNIQNKMKENSESDTN